MIKMTNGLTATKEFKDQINDLILHTFGFSFDQWHARNVWDDQYECYSIIEEGIMLANVSISRMKMLINGTPCEYLQFGTVATRKEYRGRGLSRKLMEHIFRIYPDMPSFLFANDSVLEFYPKFGFVPIAENQPYIECKLQGGGEMNKLEVTDPKVDRYLKGRSQFSKIFDCENQYAINWFHLLYGYPDGIYEIPGLDAVVVAEQHGNTLTIYDIAAIKPLAFSQILPHLHFKGVDMIRFGFNPDWLELDYRLRPYKIEDSTLFVKGGFGTDREYILPMLIRT